jgi:hypothetical protein
MTQSIQAKNRRGFEVAALRHARIVSANRQEGCVVKKGETIQKLVLFGAMTLGALLIADGYLRARAFIDRVDAADRNIALLNNEVEYLRVQLDVAPRPATPAAPFQAAQVPVIAGASQPLALPLPEPMRLPLPAQDRPQRLARTKDDPGLTRSDELAKADAVPDDGKVVLMRDAKESKSAAPPAQQEAATSTVNVKLWAQK